MWACGATRSSVYNIALPSPDTTRSFGDDSSSSESTTKTNVVTQTSAGTTVTTVIVIQPGSGVSETMGATSTSSPSVSPPPGHNGDDGVGSNTIPIIGGAVGGVALIGLAAALLFLIRRRKKKSREVPVKRSFIVRDRNLDEFLSKLPDSTIQGAATTRETSGLSTYPNPVQAPNNVAQSRNVPLMPPLPVPSPCPDLAPTYMAYHPQHASTMTASSNSLNLGSSVLSPQSSFYKPSQYQSNASFIPPVSEVHGHSASNSRASDLSQTEFRGREGSRFVELDSSAPHLSSQSGPVPEWHMKQELP